MVPFPSHEEFWSLVKAGHHPRWATGVICFHLRTLPAAKVQCLLLERCEKTQIGVRIRDIWYLESSPRGRNAGSLNSIFPSLVLLKF